MRYKKCISVNQFNYIKVVVLMSSHNLSYEAKIRNNVYPGKFQFCSAKWGLRGGGLKYMDILIH